MMPAIRNTWIKDYFTFTKKERRAVILLALFALFFSLLPALFPFLVKHETDIVIDEEKEQLLASMRTGEKKPVTSNEEAGNADWYEPKRSAMPQAKSMESKGELFYFNPNTATAEELSRLGIREKTVQTILKYRSKGGQFKKPEDISRIYGLSAKEVERLMPYVKIENTLPVASTTSNTTSVSTQPQATRNTVFSEKKSKPIDINKADTSEWKSLKGIGSYYAKKIVGFREKLGGFYKVEQVAETYGLPDSTFQSIRSFLLISTDLIKQINLNTATVEELKAHPYIKANIATAIVNYRANHGAFKSVEQLLNIGAIDNELYRKIAPYLSVE
ncbi:helix-hairpin-helix domain-containing protein [Lacibacter sp. MH-610]|uniref:ComEA family DNA-binding protein n=1 Tax=Lacibacter sp. MH-610 TaxID=3020883 RepID=UPI0038927CBA